MNREQFNAKYSNWLKEGHYGLSLVNEEVINYLDKEFQELIKIPDFKYLQIKSKFDWYCFYCENVSLEKRQEIENKIKKIYDSRT